MEPKTKKWKKEKLKKENGYAQNIGKQSKESVESVLKKTRSSAIAEGPHDALCHPYG